MMINSLSADQVQLYHQDFNPVVFNLITALITVKWNALSTNIGLPNSTLAFGEASGCNGKLGPSGLLSHLQFLPNSEAVIGCIWLMIGLAVGDGLDFSS